MCRALAEELGVVFDLHARQESFTSEGTEVTGVKVGWARSKRLTGAGDVWDAGAICGRLHRMEEPQRLRFANTAAKLYVEKEQADPPTFREVMNAL
jgi:sugar/nucleoside kinase (ribokinase family)